MKTDGPHAATSGDDFAMMRQMIYRRFERALKEDPERQLTSWPELLLIDGGRGQLNAVHEVLDELQLDDIAVVAISKGQTEMQAKGSFIFAGRTVLPCLWTAHPCIFL